MFSRAPYFTLSKTSFIFEELEFCGVGMTLSGTILKRAMRGDFTPKTVKGVRRVRRRLRNKVIVALGREALRRR